MLHWQVVAVGKKGPERSYSIDVSVSQSVPVETLVSRSSSAALYFLHQSYDQHIKYDITELFFRTSSCWYFFKCLTCSDSAAAARYFRLGLSCYWSSPLGPFDGPISSRGMTFCLHLVSSSFMFPQTPTRLASLLVWGSAVWHLTGLTDRTHVLTPEQNQQWWTLNVFQKCTEDDEARDRVSYKYKHLKWKYVKCFKAQSCTVFPSWTIWTWTERPLNVWIQCA